MLGRAFFLDFFNVKRRLMSIMSGTIPVLYFKGTADLG